MLWLKHFECIKSEKMWGKMEPKELPPPVQLMNFIVGKWISKPVYVAAELGIADMLTEGPKSVDELAQESRSHPTLFSMSKNRSQRSARLRLRPMVFIFISPHKKFLS